MKQKNCFRVAIVLAALLALCAGCTSTGTHTQYGRTDITIPDEQITAMPSVTKAVEYLAKDISQQWTGSKASFIIGYFSLIDHGKRNLLCQKIEHYLRNELNAPQTLDQETLSKLQDYWGLVSTSSFSPDYAIRGLVNDAHCLLTGTLDLQPYKNIIYVIANAHDTQTGKKLFSSRVPISFADPDIKLAWEQELELPKLQKTQLLPNNSTKSVSRSEAISLSAVGRGKNHADAYIAGQILVDEKFVREYVAPELVSECSMDKTKVDRFINQNLRGLVPPGIKYSPENPSIFYKDVSQKDMWCAEVTGTFDR